MQALLKPQLDSLADQLSCDEEAVASALRTLSTGSRGLDELSGALRTGELGQAFCRAATLLGGIGGRVVVTGMGKSGHIGSKIAATLASTGMPAFFVHPADANHGDLGMIRREDAILALSWSGESAELKGIVAYARRFAIPLLALTAGRDSALAREATVALVLPKVAEACPHGLAPTTSTLLQLALGDALAVALLERRGFTADHFRTFHPGGQLGASLRQVGEVMHRGEKIPCVRQGTDMRHAILEISKKGFGCVAILDGEGRVSGIITDGDLRRHIDTDLLALSVEEVMTPDPKTIEPDMLVATALQMLNDAAITALIVADEENRPQGIIHLHDLLRSGAA
ncbi:MAG TPA: KpsF/GutQ family sugar-phosphate isomerase [Mesorhizobium sp.]|jgi:arabinose-5-phosphate isomerase|nr:KpsF/GutQ family sugar-phosphate isomerase [Mesorhizobium sp.]